MKDEIGKLRMENCGRLLHGAQIMLYIYEKMVMINDLVT